MRFDSRREPDSPQDGPIVETPWGKLPQDSPSSWRQPATERGAPTSQPATERDARPSSTSRSGTYAVHHGGPAARHGGPAAHRPREAWETHPLLSAEVAPLLIHPEVERRLDGIFIHVRLLNRTWPDRSVTFTWTSGPFERGDLARIELETMLRNRLETALGAWIEVNGRCYTRVEDALAAFWPSPR